MTKKKEMVSGGDFKPPGYDNAVDIGNVLDNPFALPLLDEFLDGSSEKQAVLTGWEIDESGFGPFAIVTISGHGQFRSNSGAVMDQVEQLINYSEEHPGSLDNGVACIICKRTNKTGQIYYSLFKRNGTGDNMG